MKPAMPPFRLNSLRSRLMLLVALAILPLALMTILGGMREREQAIEASEENLRRLTSLAAANEAQSVERARQILVDLASVPDLLGETPRCNALLADVLDRNEGYVNFGLIQLNGEVSCSAVPMLHPVNLGDRSHFKRAVSERRFIAGDYVFGRVIRRHTINLTYPVIDRGGKVIAVVFAAMDLAGLDTFVADINLPPGSVLVTTDANGTIISRRPDPERWFGHKVSATMREAMRDAPKNSGRHAVVLRDDDDVERLHTFARVGAPSLSDYTVTIGIPVETVTAGARRAQLMSLIGLAATTMLALLAAWLAGDVLIVQRVRKLKDTARRIAAGDLDARSGIAYEREEIGQLGEALDEMAATLQKKEAARGLAERELRAADQRKDEFLAMLAHELRNPLAPISTGAHLLKLLHSDNAQITQTCAIIARQVEHMTGLVDDLLDVSRVTRGLVSISTQVLDLRRVIDDAAEQIRPLITARRHSVVLDLPPHPATVKGDHKRLVQVVANLLNNANKYTPEGGRIELGLAEAGAEYVLTVRDDGIGMEPQLVARVFDLFTQAERTPDRSQGGLGLGLALAKSLVELHGGTVQAASAGLGQGSVFTVRLPRHTQEVLLPASPSVDHAQAARPLKVLLVDDNLDAAHTLQLFLAAGGHRVEIAYSAADAVDLARVFAPDVCLLDIGLPDFDGNELARRLRRLPQATNATLVAMTGYGRQQDRDASMAAGFDNYMVKPVNTMELSDLLAQVAVEKHPR
ncbi:MULTISPECIES: ATP-binding protein [unclassified Massilia]|uniref:hybrid sensor histidine kinase/response regulator n=1 Tax=unclassified Massilia TaxID=2609279 RepID=UPI00177A8F94|nr:MULTISPECIES: ATP-binding protein [unclassified Massilia]MBD8530079.1 response regulator [Massilia sp. CFBP 13647]MBD8674092.1 response regulator [Massilia sp. CFBP 13721]